MRYKESSIAYENKHYWVLTDTKKKCYVVFESGITHSTSDSFYNLNEDGLSLAKARCDYLAKIRNFPRYVGRH